MAKPKKRRVDPLARAKKKPIGKKYAGLARGDTKGKDVYRG